MSIKNLTWQVRNRETKLIEKFVEPYKIKKIISENTVELELLELIKIHLVCYGLKLKVLSNKTTLVLSNTRELDRVPKTK